MFWDGEGGSGPDEAVAGVVRETAWLTQGTGGTHTRDRETAQLPSVCQTQTP